MSDSAQTPPAPAATAEEEVIDIDLEDPEVKAAAAKIQGNFLRRKMKTKTSSEDKPAGQ